MLFQVYQGADEKWRWRLWGDNHSDIIADSGQGYASKRGCHDGIDRVKKEINAPTVDTKTHDRPTKEQFALWRTEAKVSGY